MAAEVLVTSDDNDDRFARKLSKFLKSQNNEDVNDDKPKVKEADSIKIPAFPTSECYRNWRIKTREAVVAASTRRAESVTPATSNAAASIRPSSPPSFCGHL